jgi:CRISPR-associated protein Csb1
MNEQPNQTAAENPAADPRVAEINKHLDALLGIDARKPGAAAKLPAVVRITEILEPAGGKDFPVFPPSYAGEGTNAPPVYDLNGIEYGEILREKSAKDGTKRTTTRYIKRARHCTMDSPQSHANRTEVAFRDDEDLRSLVPQALAKIPRKPEFSGQSEANLLALPHRVADFRVRASNQALLVDRAIKAFAQGDALPLLRLMPTSILFGFWDSRAEGYQHKHARILLSRVDAFNVIPCEKHSLYTGPYSKDECASVVLKNDNLAEELFKLEAEAGPKDEGEKERASKEAKRWADAMSARGFSNALSKPGSLGGVIAERIERLAVISLTDIAGIFCFKDRPAAEKNSKNEAEQEAAKKNEKPDTALTNAARRYLIALALLAENYPRSTGSYRLRSGCELLPAAKTEEILGAGSDSEDARALIGLCGNREMLIKVAEAAHAILSIPLKLSKFESSERTLKGDLEKAGKKAAKQNKGGAERRESKGAATAAIGDETISGSASDNPAALE